GVRVEPWFVRRAAVPVAVWFEHRAREVLEDAVHHQLDAGRRVPPDGRGLPPRHELLDLVGAAVGVPPERAPDRPRQLAAPREREVRELLGMGLDDRVLPGRDPELVEMALAAPQAL